MWNLSTDDKMKGELGEMARGGSEKYIFREDFGWDPRVLPARNGWGFRATPEFTSDSGSRKGIARHRPRIYLDNVQMGFKIGK